MLVGTSMRQALTIFQVVPLHCKLCVLSNKSPALSQRKTINDILIKKND